MRKILFCGITVLLMMCMLCLPLFSATGAQTQPYLLGDADGDGIVRILDATCVQRVLARLTEDTDGGIALRGDVDNSGSLTAIDVTLIMRFLARLETGFPIGEEVVPPTEAETTEPTLEPTQEPIQAPTEAPTVKPTSKPDPYELPPI